MATLNIWRLGIWLLFINLIFGILWKLGLIPKMLRVSPGPFLESGFLSITIVATVIEEFGLVGTLQSFQFPSWKLLIK